MYAKGERERDFLRSKCMGRRRMFIESCVRGRLTAERGRASEVTTSVVSSYFLREVN